MCIDEVQVYKQFNEKRDIHERKANHCSISIINSHRNAF